MLWPCFGRMGWDFGPWTELRRLHREVNDLFDGSQRHTRIREFPPINLWSRQEDVVVTAELPGVDPEDLDVSVQGDTLTIRGARKPDGLKEGDAYHRRERGHGDFVRSIQLPHEADSDKVEGSYKKGVLTLRLPRAEADKPRQIKVKSS